jgi:hypothetical protein
MNPDSSYPLAPFHVVICGSMSALAQMEDVAGHLRTAGYRVSTPAPEETGFDWNELSLEEAIVHKRMFLTDYFETIRHGDAVLIFNVSKQGIEGYVGANTLMEAACGQALGKPVLYFQPIGDQSCRLEAAAVATAVLDGSIERLLEELNSLKPVAV